MNIKRESGGTRNNWNWNALSLGQKNDLKSFPCFILQMNINNVQLSIKLIIMKLNKANTMNIKD